MATEITEIRRMIKLYSDIWSCENVITDLKILSRTLQNKTKNTLIQIEQFFELELYGDGGIYSCDDKEPCYSEEQSVNMIKAFIINK